jgi:hypothetical protein
MDITDIALERDPKQLRARRSRPLPGLARRLSELSAELHQAAIREEARNLADHERVRGICNTAFGGSFTKILKSSPVLSDDDREFLKELKYL